MTQTCFLTFVVKANAASKVLISSIIQPVHQSLVSNEAVSVKTMLSWFAHVNKETVKVFTIPTLNVSCENFTAGVTTIDRMEGDVY